jgi:hypothetical protein
MITNVLNSSIIRIAEDFLRHRELDLETEVKGQF